MHYSLAEAELRAFAERHNIPVVETVAGKATLVAAHPLNAGPIGVDRVHVGQRARRRGRRRHRRRDPPAGLHDRLVDGVRNAAAQFVGSTPPGSTPSSTSRTPVVGDAREGLLELTPLLGDWRGRTTGPTAPHARRAQYHAYIDKIASPDATAQDADLRPGGRRHRPRSPLPTDYAVRRRRRLPRRARTTAGGRRAWTAIDCEYGFSCMGYEISGAWGAKMAHARPRGHRVRRRRLVPDDELRPVRSVLAGHKLIVIVCDNGGFAVINRLQVNQGGVAVQQPARRHQATSELVRVDFAAHAAVDGLRGRDGRRRSPSSRPRSAGPARPTAPT